MDVHGPLAARTVMSPHALQQLATRVGATRMRCQQGQQAVLLRAQVNGQFAPAELVGDDVQVQAVRDRQHGALHGALPGPLLEPGEPGGQLPARRGRRQRVVEASDQRRHPIRDRFGRSEVKRAKPRSALTLGRHEIHRLLVRRRLADHHDSRSFREQDVAEASGIGGDSDGLGRRQLREGDRRPATGQDEPGSPLPSGDRGGLVRGGFGAGRRQGDHAGSIGRARQRLVRRWLTCCQHAGPASAAPSPAADCSSQGRPVAGARIQPGGA